MPKSFSIIKRRADFLSTTGSGTKVVTKGLILFYNISNIDEVKLGYIASKKVGNAVVRNRIKRRLRQVAAQILPNLATKGYYVILARKEAYSRKFIDLKKDLIYSFEKCYS